MISPHARKELAAVMVGKRLGVGVYRKVYVNRFDPTTVIKIEENGKGFCNVKEWEVWEAFIDTAPTKKFLAPCRFISPCGTILIQDRTWPIMTEDLPKKIPSFINGDLKSENWGWLKYGKPGKMVRRPVCHDYGGFLIGDPLRLVKADWSRG